MNYPLISEYVEAIKAAEDNFDQLNHLRPVLGEDGKPVMTSGNFAVVFKMKDEQTGKLHAVKCFLKEQEGRAEAYRLIAEELEYVSSTFFMPIKYLEKELFVDTNASDETEFPVLLMDWVEGHTIEQLLNGNSSSDEIYDIAYKFSKFALWMLSQPFAHGDLKPDNIIIKENGDIVLVDYDGMYVPAMTGTVARENGTPGYRDPFRTQLPFDEHIDDFSLIVIELSLLLIAKDFHLYQSPSNEKLLFTEHDLINLRESKIYQETVIYKKFSAINDLYSQLEQLMITHKIEKRNIKKIEIPPCQDWDSSILFSSDAIALLGDFLWKIRKTDYIRDINLDERILDIHPFNYSNEIYLRICKGDSAELLEFLVCDGVNKGYSSIKISEFKQVFLSLDMWDESIDNKIKII